MKIVKDIYLLTIFYSFIRMHVKKNQEWFGLTYKTKILEMI